jgi:hypothetical protein
MSCRRGGGHGRRGRSRPPPPCETRPPPCHGRRGRSCPPPVRSPRPRTAAARHVRPDRHRTVVTVVEAASRQSDLRGHPPPPRETRPPPRRGHRGRSRPPRHGCRCAAWWGRERGAAAALVLVRWLVGQEEVAEHPLHCLRRLGPRPTIAPPLLPHFTPSEEREKRERENGRERDREWMGENHEREREKTNLASGTEHDTQRESTRSMCHFWMLVIGWRREV